MTRVHLGTVRTCSYVTRYHHLSHDATITVGEWQHNTASGLLEGFMLLSENGSIKPSSKPEVVLFTSWMPSLSPIQQCQSTAAGGSLWLKKMMYEKKKNVITSNKSLNINY